MSIIDDFEHERRSIEVDRIAMTRSVLGQVNQLTRQVYGDPKTNDQGIFMRLRMAVDDPKNNYPPLNSLLPTYLTTSRELFISLNVLRRYYEGGGDDEFTKTGIVQRLNNLVLKVLTELDGLMQQKSEFESALNDEKKRLQDDVENYQRQIRILEAQIITLKMPTGNDMRLVKGIYTGWLEKTRKKHVDVREKYIVDKNYRLAIAASLFLYRYKNTLDVDVFDFHDPEYDHNAPILGKKDDEKKVETQV